jgi:phosphatidylglycerophosphate synthase
MVIASHGCETVVAGVPLLLRAVVSAQRAGLGRVFVVCDGDCRQTRALLDRDRRAWSVQIVRSNEIDGAGNGHVVTIPADCLVTVRSVQAMIGTISDHDGHDARPPGGHSPIRVQTNADIARAEAALFAEIRAATAQTDGPIARLDRALSLRLSRWLVRTPLRPNHITLIGTCIGLFAAWALAQGGYGLALMGAWLFWAAVIIDGCDGEVARLKFLESRYGALFDVITDNIVHVAIFVGLAVGAQRAGHVENVSWLAATSIAGFLCASAATYFCLLHDGPVTHRTTASRRGRLRRRLLLFFEALMNRDFAYLLLALALVDRLHWFLWGTVFGTYTYALGLFLVYRLGDEGAPALGSPGAVRDSPR